MEKSAFMKSDPGFAFDLLGGLGTCLCFSFLFHEMAMMCED